MLTVVGHLSGYPVFTIEIFAVSLSAALGNCVPFAMERSNPTYFQMSCCWLFVHAKTNATNLLRHSDHNIITTGTLTRTSSFMACVPIWIPSHTEGTHRHNIWHTVYRPFLSKYYLLCKNKAWGTVMTRPDHQGQSTKPALKRKKVSLAVKPLLEHELGKKLGRS